MLDKHILTTGFNGSSADQPHFDEIGHFLLDRHCVPAIHAQTNAIIQAALHAVVHTRLFLFCHTFSLHQLR